MDLRITAFADRLLTNSRTRLAAELNCSSEIGSEKRRREIDFKIDKHEQK